MDLCDIAAEIEMLDRAHALQRHAGQMSHGESAIVCQNTRCGDEIPAARRRAVPGVQFCVHCQQLKEREALR